MSISAKTILRRISILGITFSLVGYFAACSYLYLTQVDLVFIPAKLSQDFKFSFTVPYEEHTLRTEDGGEISTALFPVATTCTEERGALLFFHGNASTIESFALRPPVYVNRCWKVLLVDYRPFGKSKGSVSPKTPLIDARTAYKFLTEQSPNKPVVLYGHSLGTGIVAQFAKEVSPQCIVLEAPFVSVADVAKSRYPIFPIDELLKYPFHSDAALKDAKFQIYIIHGTADDIVPYAQGKRLAELTGAQFVTVEGANHINLASTEEFDQLMDEVLGKHAF